MTIENSGDTINKLVPNQVGFWGLVFQGLGGIAPIGIMFALIGVADFTSGAMALAYLLGFGGALLAGNSLFWFSRKIANARGYYGYVNAGLGKYAGTFTAYSYIFYAASNAAGLILFYLVGFSGSLNQVFGTNLPWWVGIFFASSGLIVVFYGMYRGLKPSIRAMVVLGIAQVLVLTVISIIFMAHATDNTVKPFTPYVGWSDIFLGFVTGGYLAYGGYGSIISLGEETRTPNKTVGRAIIVILLIGAFSWIIASYASATAWGLSNMSSFVSSEIPTVILAKKYTGLAGTALMTLLYDIVIYTLLNNFLTSGSRVVYAMGRDKLLPESMAKIHPKYKAPIMGIIGITAITVLLAAVTTAVLIVDYGVPNGIIDSYIILGVLTTLLALLVHGLTNVSLVSSGLKKKFGKVSAQIGLTHLLLPVISLALTILAIYYAILGISFPFEAAPLVFVIFCVTLMVVMVVRKKKILDLKPIGESIEQVSSSGGE